MTISQAISSGLRATWRAKWMVLIFFACNLLFAAAVAAPMHKAIADHLGASMTGQQMAHGFDWSWLMEFQIAYAPFLESFSIAIVYSSILFLALNAVLSAGAFEIYTQHQRAEHSAIASPGWDLHAFGRGMGKYFLRFARLVLVATVFYFVAFWFWNGPVANGLDRLFVNSAVERWHFYLNWLRVALLIFSVVVINLVVDYAKADIVIDEHRSSLAALGHAAGFAWARFGRVLAIYLSLAVLTGIAIFVYSAFARFFPQSSVATIFIWFVVAQILLCLRWTLRLASWGATVAYYASHRETRSEIPIPAEVA